MAAKKTEETNVEKPIEQMTTEEIQRAAAILQLKTAQAAFIAATNPTPAAPAALSGYDEELRAVQLETARLGLEAAKEANQKTKETKAERIARRKAALANMKAEALTKKRVQAACRHRVGGKGLDDMLRGGKGAGTAIICTALPIAGMKLYLCSRCGDESVTPSPKLEQTNPAEYARQMEKYRRFEEMFADSYNAVAMGGPTFAFEQKGMPIHPDMIPADLMPGSNGEELSEEEAAALVAAEEAAIRAAA